MELKPVIPFEPISSDRIPAGDRWIYQIKWDGVRMLMYRDSSGIRLINRKRNVRTAQYPEFHPFDLACDADTFILDGEMIAFDDSKPSFHEVMKRDGLRRTGSIEAAVKRIPVVYMVFDILFHNGEWTINRTLEERQKLLRSVLKTGPLVQLTESFPDGEALFEAMKARQMEGIVCKDLDSAYALDGKDGRWVKRKISRDLYAAIGGVTYKDGRANALLLGLYAEDGRFVYVGHAGPGKLAHAEWTRFVRRLLEAPLERMPFANRPERIKDAEWTIPRLVVKVHYLERTPGGTMRHPTVQAVMDAMSPGECRLDQLL
ncbi:RNA ligase family protein [Cohnella sp. AR92]|uniref:ATP-dependent DNA ligase n=1 Tax=Cohnella sp. AR92 TaxID=648716 RepID=UPI000F8DF822|nr:RNA ligase family protein [Cohnella sp. AR92]RUS45310.1 DNA ligase [Cohnella sp. AR92]